MLSVSLALTIVLCGGAAIARLLAEPARDLRRANRRQLPALVQPEPFTHARTASFFTHARTARTAGDFLAWERELTS